MAKEKFYTSERNVQIVLSLLKANGIRKIIASPGATNFTFVGSVQNDPFFEVYSAVDERSAAYMACGMAAESGEAVALSCTGATASRNYYPGLTEAFYRKLPVLAITSHQGTDRIGQLIPQNIDRRILPNDIARLSVELPVVKDCRDEDYVVMEVNKAMLELRRNGGGPVHINLITTYSRDFSVKELPHVKVMRRFQAWDELPVLPEGRIGIYVGSHTHFSEKQNRAIDRFCATYDAVVICDHTSGYYGKYKLLPTLVQLQSDITSPFPPLDLMVHIGEISAASFNDTIPAKEVWRVSEDGELRDPFKKLTTVFQMSEEMFFLHYGKDGCNRHVLIDECRWKIQCKLPPKTKRFCPLKTFNNAPLKSLDRWGYYYFSLFPSVCSHFTDTFSCQLNPVRRMYNTIHNGICYCRVSDCIIPIVRWQLRGDDDGLAPMSVLYYIEQDGSFLGIKVHKEEVIQYEQRAPFDSLEFRFQCAFYFCHLKRTHKFRSIRIICPYALLAGFIPHCCGKEALPGTG